MATLSRRTLLRASGLTAAGLAATEAGWPAAGPVDAGAGTPPHDDPEPYVLRLSQLPPVAIPDALARKGNKAAWPILSSLSIAAVEIAPGALRAPHFHPNTPELVLIVRGRAQGGLIGPSGQQQVAELNAGDCIFFPLGWPHWLHNTGTEPLIAYFNYSHEQPETFEVADVTAFVSRA